MDDGLAKLNELMWGYRASRALHVLCGLKVFTRLAGGAMSCDALASACGAEAGVLETLLIAGAAMGLLDKDGSAYCNSALSATYLAEGKPLYQGNIIAHSARVWDVWGELPKAAGIAELLKGDSGEHRDFILGMHNITMAGRGALFLEAVDLTGRRSLADIGGGPGTYSILACQRYPGLRATVFDLPATAAITREVIGQHGLTARIGVQEGSWETDEFGRGYDAALLSNVLHGAGSQAGMKLRKAYAALEAGGLLAVQEFVLNDAKTGPLVPALFNVMVGAYSRAELAGEIEKAGFVDVQAAGQDAAVGSLWLTARRP
jgi:hypothetical protein